MVEHPFAATLESAGQAAYPGSTTKDGPGCRAANSDRALTPEAESEALMSIAPHPCDDHQGPRHG